MTAATGILPVKRLTIAKQRLSSGLSGRQRRDLMKAMVRDTIEALQGARALEAALVVSSDREVAGLAGDAGLEVIPEAPEGGHSQAAMTGISRALERGSSTVVLLPCDCPMLDPRDIDRLLTGHPEPFVTVVPDRHGTGTNALVLSPPGAIEPSFGEGSCTRHTELARAAGVPFAVEPVPSLGLDLDTPADLVALAREMGRSGAPRRRSRTAEVLGL